MKQKLKTYKEDLDYFKDFEVSEELIDQHIEIDEYAIYIYWGLIGELTFGECSYFLEEIKYGINGLINMGFGQDITEQEVLGLLFWCFGIMLSFHTEIISY